MSDMALSKRRFQFLDKLMELYQKKRLPIHYEALAQAVGVSKWTAYDMLKEIEKSGYVTRSYAVNPNETGRSQVVFAPTEKAKELFARHVQEREGAERWEETARRIKERVSTVMQSGMQEAFRKMKEAMPRRRSALEDCGCLLGVLALSFKQAGGKAEAALKQMLGKVQNPHSRLMLFAGTAMGAVCHSADEERSGEIAAMIGEMAEKIGKLSQGEQEWLCNFVMESFAVTPGH